MSRMSCPACLRWFARWEARPRWWLLAAGPALAQQPQPRRPRRPRRFRRRPALRAAGHARSGQARHGGGRARSDEEFLAGRHRHSRFRRQSRDVPQDRQYAALRQPRPPTARRAPRCNSSGRARRSTTPSPQAAAACGFLALKDITPLEGGLPLVANGMIVGAIGVSGALSAQDAQIAKAGADTLAKPGM